MPSLNNRKSALVVACAILFVTASSRSLRAQVDMGGVTGTVKDPTGAVVAGVELTVTNEATGVAQKVRSSSAGSYVLRRCASALTL